MNLQELVHVLRVRGGFELVNHNESPNQLRLLGRVQRASVDGWLLTTTHLLGLSEQSTWSIDISKMYLRREGKLRFAWRILLQAKDVEKIYAQVAKGITSAPRARAILEEVPLVGVGASRNTPSAANRGKGAQSPHGAKVGPFAFAMLQGGS
jgi:hypothetical protein